MKHYTKLQRSCLKENYSTSVEILKVHNSLLHPERNLLGALHIVETLSAVLRKSKITDHSSTLNSNSCSHEPFKFPVLSESIPLSNASWLMVNAGLPAPLGVPALSEECKS